MELFLLNAGNYKMDGGACFGVVPKSLWSRYYPCDENNLIKLSLRCLLIKTEDKLILIDTGLGNKMAPDHVKHFHLFGDKNLLEEIQDRGFQAEDITDLILTHLHFDHCGGASYFAKNGKVNLTFPNADIWVSKKQWEWANNPNPREKASYLKENLEPLANSCRLHLTTEDFEFIAGLELNHYHGHTDGQIIPKIKSGNKTYHFMADFIPFMASIPIPYVPSFDTRPLISMKEKERFLESACKQKELLIFQHDYYNEACELTLSPKGVRGINPFILEIK